ncbi:MAG: PRC-barrel domain-containing protein [Gemmatimonadota bacterium]|nr:PRC-barrel domain-containing protein [Gemmatimonadota bacterium]
MQRSLKDLEGYAVCATDGEIGHVVDFLLDDQQWAVRYLVVEAGGFLAGRRVLISPIAFRDVDWSTRQFHLALTIDKVKASPAVDTDKPVSRQHERDYNRFYGYPDYWNYGSLWGMGMYPALLAGVGWKDAEVNGNQATGDASLRSAGELRHYHVQGTDDAIGHVDDFIADDATWGIRYLVVDTSNWWFGEKVLVSPHWAHRISWKDKNVYVDMSRDAIKNSPEWNGEAAVNRQYEQRLYDYYGRPAYWGSEGHPADEQPSATHDTAASVAPNPPRTTSFGWFTAPKFGSAGGGGAELEPGPERD